MLNFKSFDPQTGNSMDLPQCAGNYLICLKEGAELPKTGVVPVFREYKGLRVLYTGISKNIQKRDFKQHFNGSAGRSTLRKSIGSLFGYKLIPRSKNNPDDGKTTFFISDEEKLSAWMKANLLLFYCVKANCEEEEQGLIDQYNPPLNLSKNRNIVNLEFRELLSDLRNRK